MADDDLKIVLEGGKSYAIDDFGMSSPARAECRRTADKGAPSRRHLAARKTARPLSTSKRKGV